MLARYIGMGVRVNAVLKLQVEPLVEAQHNSDD